MGTHDPIITHRGGQIAYRLRGAGPNVLMIQGVGVHGDGWLPQVEAMQSRFTCVTFDNRGMGRSDPPPKGEPLTVQSMADDCAVLMQRLGWTSAHVIGHSLGGAVALQLALDAPQHVDSLSLLCTFASGRDAAPMTMRMLYLGMRTRLGSRSMRRSGFLQLVMSRRGIAATPDAGLLAVELEPLFGHDLADQPPVVNQQLKALRAFDVSDRLNELAAIPTLVVTAAEDPIAPPRAGRRLAQGIPGARYVELDNASHGVPIEQPARMNELLIEHLSANP